mmetsp:Transcript_18980/g.47224  ORF Transcript_18980/g.47224 Transcript_18980/m.47224 type:complete len:174 (-) Transcript_18980:270-791(-)
MTSWSPSSPNAKRRGSPAKEQAAPPPSAPKSQAVLDIEAEAAREEEGNYCRFYFIYVAEFKKYKGKTMPKFQELREKYPKMLVDGTLTFHEAMVGKHVEDNVTISHRWINSVDPDPDGVQLAKMREYLENNPQIERLWYDAWCIAQGERSAVDTADFKRMLPQVCDEAASCEA